MAKILFTRHILSDGDGSLYECGNRETCRRVTVTRDGLAEFQYGADPRDTFTETEAIAAVQALLDDEHERFLAWAEKRNLPHDAQRRILTAAPRRA